MADPQIDPRYEPLLMSSMARADEDLPFPVSMVAEIRSRPPAARLTSLMLKFLRESRSLMPRSGREDVRHFTACRAGLCAAKPPTMVVAHRSARGNHM